MTKLGPGRLRPHVAAYYTFALADPAFAKAHALRRALIDSGIDLAQGLRGSLRSVTSSSSCRDRIRISANAQIGTVQNRPTANAADFTRAWQQAFARWCAVKKGHAVGTISRNLSIIAAAMSHALKSVVVDEDDGQREVQLLKYAVPVIYKAEEVSQLTGKPVSQPRDWLLTFEEMAAFIDGIGRLTKAGEWDQNRENLFRYVVMGLNTWARHGAILEPSVSKQFDFAAGLVKLNPPGRRQTKKFRRDGCGAESHRWIAESTGPVPPNGLPSKLLMLLGV